ncbi:MAG: hypothetical protein HQL50_16425 [Magnetococcales bacterium]|nr:hypothetical protein [Magnetococcales bacterium]
METNPERERRIGQTQGLMVFLGALTDGLEGLTGRGAQAISFRAGRQVGLAWEVERKEPDLMAALEQVRIEMNRMGINWPFEIYKRQDEADAVTIDEKGLTEIKMTFRNCMVRCTLFRYGFPQEMSLCQTKHGLFCGLLEQIYGVSASLGVIHSGENACLLKLRFQDKA